MNVADKQWVLTVVSPASGQLAVLRDGTALPSEIGPGATTPVELLLASIGTCFALSCWAAFASRGLERMGFEVRVIGRKDAQPPSRLSSINLRVTFDVSLPLVEAQAVIASAERLCTVTNTMTFEPPCAIELDVANGGGRNEAAT
jgi:uncharacterized OsmC-like protein